MIYQSKSAWRLIEGNVCPVIIINQIVYTSLYDLFLFLILVFLYVVLLTRGNRQKTHDA